MRFIESKFRLLMFRRQWRKKNSHNTTIAANVFSIESVNVGVNTYGAIRVLNWGRGEQLSIGHFCSIAQEVIFILNADHYLNHISTFPFKAKMLNSEMEGVSKGNIVVEDDVWIGYGAIIMSGVHISQGAVVAAGSVVTKNVPPYAVVGGVPARVIKFRFEENIIEELLKIDYSKLTTEMIAKHVDDLYTELKDVKQAEWMPR